MFLYYTIHKEIPVFYFQFQSIRDITMDNDITVENTSVYKKLGPKKT